MPNDMPPLPDPVDHFPEAGKMVDELRTILSLPAGSDVVEAVREVVKNSERYQWLRNEAQWRDDPVPQAIIWKRNGHAQEICAEDDLDAAIDSAKADGGM